MSKLKRSWTAADWAEEYYRLCEAAIVDAKCIPPARSHKLVDADPVLVDLFEEALSYAKEKRDGR